MKSSEENVTVERLNLKPEWVEESGAKSGEFLRPLVLFFLGGFIILLFLGGGLGENLAIILTVWISLCVIFAGIKNIKSLSPWKRDIKKKKIKNLPLKSTSETTKRALKGLELSQMLIEKRLGRDLIEKIKEEESLTEKDVRKLIENPSELKKVINDEELFYFITNSKTIEDISQKDTELLFLKVKNLFNTNINGDKEEQSFDKRIKKIIKKISEWESR